MKTLLCAAYVAAWFATWPALIAFDMAAPSAFSCRNYRHYLGGDMFFALLPPLWIIAPFWTGFYEHGFLFSRPKVCAFYETNEG